MLCIDTLRSAWADYLETQARIAQPTEVGDEDRLADELNEARARVVTLLGFIALSTPDRV